MEISEILSPERVINKTEVSSKKAALESLAGLISSADPSLTQSEVFESLVSREKLGSTGLGHGIALPHGRRHGGSRTIGAFMRLDTGIQYDAIDQKPVDLFFALLVPEKSTDEHLQILSKLAGIFSDSTVVNEIRECDSPDSVFQMLTSR
jgi:PTS system nitrogen regulatory IIA component